VISEEKGMKMHEVGIEVCGKAEKVIVNKETTTIIGGIAGEALELRVKDLERQIEDSTSEWDKINMKDRMAQLTGGIGVVRVGAYTDTEFNAKKYKFQNAINATQAALQEGIVAGGGSALAFIPCKEEMFSEVLYKPFIQMAKNAGMEVSCSDLKKDEGYDFKTGEKVNMFDAGIVDPFKVTRLALESATAIAMSLVGTETVISIKNETEIK